MKKIFILVLIQVLAYNCSNHESMREFTFIYDVELESSNGKKIELWLPIPQSNEVQIISNLKIDAKDLNLKLKDEKTYRNRYAYIYSLEGTDESKSVTMSFDVKRFEHKNVNYDNVNPNIYLGSTSMVPTGSIFIPIIKRYFKMASTAILYKMVNHLNN